MQPNLLRNRCFLPTKNKKYRTFYRTHFLLISITCLSRYISLSFYRPALFQTSESCIKLHAVDVLELLLSEQCPLLRVCVCVCVCVCVSTAPSVCVCVHCSRCVCVCVSTAPGVCFHCSKCVCVCPLLQVCVCVCVCPLLQVCVCVCVCPLLQVCVSTAPGVCEIQRTHFTAGYILYNFFFFFLPIMVKSLIIGKPIYRSISSRDACLCFCFCI